MMKYLITLLTALFISNASAEIGITVTGGGGEPAPIDGQLQYNNGGEFGATTNIYYDDVNQHLGIGVGASPLAQFHFNGNDIQTHSYPLIGQSTLNIGYDSFGAGNVTNAIATSAYGYRTLYNLVSGDRNSVFGYNGAYSNKGGYDNSVYGVSSFYFNTNGNSNSSYGNYSLEDSQGNQNSSFGFASARQFTGNNLSAFGAYCLGNTTTATGLAGFGRGCMYYLIDGNGNSGFGDAALQNNKNGDYNSVFGSGVMNGHFPITLATNVNNNSIFGYHGAYIYYGDSSTMMGKEVGANLTTADRCLILGADVDAPSAVNDGQVAIANIIFGTGCVGTGTTIPDTANFGVGENTPLSRLHVTGGFSTTITTVNAATYQTTGLESILHVTYTAIGSVAITLDTDEVTNGRRIIIKDAGGNATANNIVIDTEGAETIDGAADLTISTDYNSVSLYTDGSNWFTY